MHGKQTIKRLQFYKNLLHKRIYTDIISLKHIFFETQSDDFCNSHPLVLTAPAVRLSGSNLSISNENLCFDTQLLLSMDF